MKKKKESKRTASEQKFIEDSLRYLKKLEKQKHEQNKQ
jgi:hypothetical protein